MLGVIQPHAIFPEAHTPGVCPGLPDTVALTPDNLGEYFDVESL